MVGQHVWFDQGLYTEKVYIYKCIEVKEATIFQIPVSFFNCLPGLSICTDIFMNLIDFHHYLQQSFASKRGYLSLQLEDVSDDLFNFLLGIFLLAGENMSHIVDTLLSQHENPFILNIITHQIFIIMTFRKLFLS